MLREDRCSTALVKAREKRGWSRYQASQRCGINANVIRTLEGANPDRAPNPQKTELRIVMALILLYWPDVSLADFMGRRGMLRLAPDSTKARRDLKGYVSA
jgi:hypothetical protein